MGIFKRKTAAPRRERAVDSAFNDAEREGLKALWRLTALPLEEFNTTYGDMLSRIWGYVAAPAGEDWQTLSGTMRLRARPRRYGFARRACHASAPPRKPLACMRR